MGSLTSDKPKCLLPLEGRPLLAWQISALAKAGVHPKGLVTGYRATSLASFGDFRLKNPEWATSQMVSSLLCASSWLEANETVVTYSDIVYKADTIRRICAAPGDIVVAYHTDWRRVWTLRFEDPLVDAEEFRVDADGFLQSVGGKPQDLAKIPGQYMGIFKLTPAGWRTIHRLLESMPPSKVKKLDVTALLALLLSSNVEIRTLASNEAWFEIDSTSDWLLSQRLLAGFTV